jgi:hypothetical protein
VNIRPQCGNDCDLRGYFTISVCSRGRFSDQKSASFSLENNLTEEACLNDVFGQVRVDQTGLQ